ncbi:hypothetical protein ERO13_D03G142750v2 [Gossypium hirsutum]|nr:hypothetical protein ERO13_D03G142750v2 [Gossypium hirsutum]
MARHIANLACNDGVSCLYVCVFVSIVSLERNRPSKQHSGVIHRFNCSAYILLFNFPIHLLSHDSFTV